MPMLMWIVVGVAVWLGLVLFVLAVLTAAKRGDEALQSAIGAEAELPAASQSHGQAGPVHRASAVVHATDEFFGRLAADVHGVLGVERVAVVLYDEANPDSGVVQASCGRPELVGSRVPGGGGFGWGVGRDSSFLVEPAGDGGAWSVVSVPIAAGYGVVGIVAVATCRRRGLSALDAELLERVARRATAIADRSPAAQDGDEPKLQRRPAV